MQILYLANARIPTEKAHGLQIVKMCEAFARQGVDVELVVPFRQQSEQMRQVESLWEYYDVTTTYPIKRLPSPDFIRYDRYLPARIMTLLYMLQSLLFAIMASVTTRKAEGVYYTRDWYALFVLAIMKRWHGKPIFFEAHEMHGASHAKLLTWLLRRGNGLIVITQALQTYYAQFGVAAEQIIVAADGLDQRRLTPQISRDAARTELDLSLTSKIVCYTGHLFRWKGVYTLAEAMRHLPEDYRLYIIGGMTKDRQALQQFIAEQHLPRITLIEHVPYHAVPRYLAAADVLALPNSAEQAISRDCTSPLKLFEYMAAQRPIVASDLPSLREVLRHEQNAYLVTPDQPHALANGIQHVLNDQTLRTRIVETAYTDVQAFTWDGRAKNILAFLRTAIHAN
ncbi:glycosyl transferase, group 1 family protein [Candidatus Moduliflexus flocculans]|uniref:Glycosyl transferase, group 1 family protein n=1 Tax=Candidatus Moduliflexus flocculans TaxID=1499966 RepID=A0A0S6VR54_9BACT|nr:glycosyl transferase, group 1 family protein [Candidatus Moduliflexus flocculans]